MTPQSIESEAELREAIEKLFNPRISSSGAMVELNIADQSVNVDYEALMEIKEAILHLIRQQNLALLAELEGKLPDEITAWNIEKLIPANYAIDDNADTQRGFNKALAEVHALFKAYEERMK